MLSERINIDCVIVPLLGELGRSSYITDNQTKAHLAETCKTLNNMLNREMDSTFQFVKNSNIFNIFKRLKCIERGDWAYFLGIRHCNQLKPFEFLNKKNNLHHTTAAYEKLSDACIESETVLNETPNDFHVFKNLSDVYSKLAIIIKLLDKYLQERGLGVSKNGLGVSLPPSEALFSEWTSLAKRMDKVILLVESKQLSLEQAKIYMSLAANSWLFYRKALVGNVITKDIYFLILSYVAGCSIYDAKQIFIAANQRIRDAPDPEPTPALLSQCNQFFSRSIFHLFRANANHSSEQESRLETIAEKEAEARYQRRVGDS